MLTVSFKPIRVYNGGSALSADTEPNSAAPDETRIVNYTPSPAGTGIIFGSAFGGTSLVYKVWGYSPAHSKWIPLSAAITVNADAGSVSANVGQTWKKIFVQITTVTGATEFFYGHI